MLSIPMVLEMAMESLFALVDAYFVAKVSPDAVATVGLTESVITLVYAIAIGISTAPVAMISRYVGQKDHANASRVAKQAIFLAVGVSLVLGIPGVVYAEDILGMMGGSMGETSAVLLLLGGLFLLWKRIITWHIPVSIIGTLLVLAGIMHAVNPDVYPGVEVHLLAGATLLGAFFIATDLVTSPVSPTGQLIFGVGCGLLVYVIRTWAGYPEGMAFAVLLMNAVTPLIDHYFRPRIYGRDRKGEPLNYASGENK